MRKKVEFELLNPLICGGVRISDNFLESESFIRGSVLRAAFANEILLECPLASVKGSNGELYFIEEKDPKGQCADCPKKDICRSFSDMYFSVAYPLSSIPAPFTIKVCKAKGCEHRLQDTIVQNGRLLCQDCERGLKRMESAKGFLCQNGDRYRNIKIHTFLTTHTAINYDTHTAEDGKLFTIKAVPRGTVFTAVIDDCNTGMLQEGTVVYCGKYVSSGYGKMMIRSLTDEPQIKKEQIETDIRNFQERLDAPKKAALLFMSDAVLDIQGAQNILPNDEYLDIWQKALFGESETALKVEKVFAETQLYSGYCTSREWGKWKDSQPVLLVKKGTSVLLDLKDEPRAVEILTELVWNGAGERTLNGFGQIAVCHPLHRLGVHTS